MGVPWKNRQQSKRSAKKDAGQLLGALPAWTYLCYDALFPRLPELIPGNETDVAVHFLPACRPALSALQRVGEWPGDAERGALSLHLLCLPSQVAVLRVQMTRDP